MNFKLGIKWISIIFSNQLLLFCKQWCWIFLFLWGFIFVNICKQISYFFWFLKLTDQMGLEEWWERLFKRIFIKSMWCLLYPLTLRVSLSVSFRFRCWAHLIFNWLWRFRLNNLWGSSSSFLNWRWWTYLFYFLLTFL